MVVSAIIAVGSFGSLKKVHAEEMNIIGLSNELIRLQRGNDNSLEVIDESFIDENVEFVKSLTIGDGVGIVSLSQFTYCKIENGFANVRKGPGTEYESLGRFYGGAVATAIKKDEEKGWTKIISGNIEGYVSNEFLVFGQDAVDLQKARNEKKRRVMGKTVNLRSAATKESGIVHELPGYIEVTILEKTNINWYKVRYSNGYKTYIGYISTSYLSDGYYYAINAAQAKELQSKSLLDNIAWPYPTNFNIASDYGYRKHPITGEYKMHTGLDIGGRTGDTVVAALDGVVAEVGWDNGGGGNYVVIRSNTGGATVTCHYLHLNNWSVSVGQTVVQGQKVGSVGMTGSATGPHLHFTMKVNGVKVDPMNYLFKYEYALKWLNGRNPD
jgi:murein DD-endopeptidase MepM/ murein hydrolase activator NlpD